jgi:N-[(2S)-2-amino-2-carboxyethyl]-L-glutamate dehydrogenase
MKYLNDKDICEIGFNWNAIFNVIESTTSLLNTNNYSQPIKPYLRFKDLRNRIIAMPAYVGGDTEIAGIKWIASFPENIKKNKPRAHSVIVLNDADNGEPVSVINSPLVSAVRTAGVTGSVIRKYLESRSNGEKMNAGVIGFGPIGQLHLRMLKEAFGDVISQFYLFDIKEIDPEKSASFGKDVIIARSWEEVYDNCQIFITCTVSSHRYINREPRKGSLYLNISLRDFEAGFLKEVDLIIVDNWDEICRENTDIECAHNSFGLSKENVVTIADLEKGNSIFNKLSEKSVMFNPMGMAVFDMAIAKYYYDLAAEEGIGVSLD